MQFGAKTWEKSLKKILDEKVNAHLPYYSTLKKFWNGHGFFQTFKAGLLFSSWLLLTSRLSHPFKKYSTYNK